MCAETRRYTCVLGQRLERPVVATRGRAIRRHQQRTHPHLRPAARQQRRLLGLLGLRPGKATRMMRTINGFDPTPKSSHCLRSAPRPAPIALALLVTSIVLAACSQPAVHDTPAPPEEAVSRPSSPSASMPTATPTPAPTATPTAVPTPTAAPTATPYPWPVENGDRFVDISSGILHTCALRADGHVVCWGSDEWGRSSPPEGERFIAVSSGNVHTCALTEDRTAVCWGGGGRGAGR